jgi:hypothetical protein
VVGATTFLLVHIDSHLLSMERHNCYANRAINQWKEEIKLSLLKYTIEIEYLVDNFFVVWIQAKAKIMR